LNGTNIIDNWFIDKDSNHRWIYHKIKRLVLSTRTKFQQAEFIDTYNLGRVVILDNKIQSAEVDEFMIIHPEPKNILILGGGEGATLREVLKHPSVKRVVVVDIDEEFVNLCKKYLIKWHQGSFNDKRVEVVFADAKEYIRKTKAQFDVSIADLSDPVDEGPAQGLYSKKFYSSIKRTLKQGGIFVTHATGVSYTPNGNISIRILKTLSDIFSLTAFYYEYIQSFGSLWGFVLCSQKYSPKELLPAMIAKRLKRRGLINLSYYDQETHERLFCLPKCLRTLLKTK
jgi:spermidine synthase